VELLRRYATIDEPLEGVVISHERVTNGTIAVSGIPGSNRPNAFPSCPRKMGQDAKELKRPRGMMSFVWQEIDSDEAEAATFVRELKSPERAVGRKPCATVKRWQL
jgi:hypothetical protein